MSQTLRFVSFRSDHVTEALHQYLETSAELKRASVSGGTAMVSRPSLLVITTVGQTHRAFLLPFARYFRSLGWRVDGAAAGITDMQECVQEYDRVYEVDWSRNPLDPRNLSRAASRVRDLVRQAGYDLVHVHTPVAAFVARYALRNLRTRSPVKVVYTAHGFHFHGKGSPLRALVFRTLEEIAGHWTDYLIVINREDEASARKHRLVSEERLGYVPGIGLDTSAYSKESVSVGEVARVRSELGLGQATPLFLMVAEFIPRKRHHDMVEAFARVQRRSAHLAFAGDGPLLNSVRCHVHDLGLAQRVHFLGHRRDIPALMRASIATVMPSGQEGLNRSVMESLALQVPVIGSDARGVVDLLRDGCGVVVPVGDVAAFADAMDWIVEHPEDARLMARLGRQRVVEHHDIGRVLKRYREIYAQLLGRS